MQSASTFDWNAAAAWIALAISLVGSIAGPIITTILTNRHQLKLRMMDIHEKTISAYDEKRFKALNTFIAKAGKCLAYGDDNFLCELGEAYFQIYQYVPSDFWPTLDQFYKFLIEFDYNNAHEMYPQIIYRLTEILKETPQAPR